MGEKIIFTVLYIIDVIFHNYKLKQFNQELEGLNSIEVVLYKNGASWNYLGWSVILILIGLLFIYWFWKSRRHIYDAEDFWVLIGLTLIIFVSFIFTIVFISNPILQSVCVVIICVGMGVIAQNS
ncbi:hypothetical protein AB3329_01910 [Streptococcus sp. H31]|uniref:hypothetical protein n=1 Tax=Streptococcus huangxiaojuni TaxID=3237239 RepID=UPI0034A1F5C3